MTIYGLIEPGGWYPVHTGDFLMVTSRFEEYKRFNGFAMMSRWNNRHEPPVDWFGAFDALLREVKHADYQYMDAVLMRLLGRDSVAVLMVRHLLAWFPKTIRSDGAIWRNADEWSRYCGISESQVYNKTRRERLCRIGISCWNERAYGEKQLHFKLDVHVLSAAIARTLGIGISKLKAICWREKEVSSAEAKDGSLNGKVGSLPGKNPLTRKTTEKTTDKQTNKTNRVGQLLNLSSVEEIFDRMIDFGWLTTADKSLLSGISRENVVACLGSFEEADVRYPRKYLSKALRAHVPKSYAVPENLQRIYDAPPTFHRCTECGAKLFEWSSECSNCRKNDVKDAGGDESVLMPICQRLHGGWSNAQDCWDATFNQLRMQLDRASFDTWLQHARLLSCNNDRHPGKYEFVVGVHNSYAQDMLQHRLYRNVRRVLSDVTRKDVEIKFENTGEKPPAEGEPLFRFMRAGETG